jgi:hypothetical protein
MTQHRRYILLLGYCWSMAVLAGPSVVAEADREAWWIWANPPAINLAAEQAIMRADGASALEVRFAFTIDSGGRVADCAVAHQSEVAFDAATLCELIALQRYRPAAGNRARAPIRTEQLLLIGVPPAQASMLVDDQPQH